MNDKICGYFLDKQQQEIVLDNSNHLLVVAGAGSGKTLTILGKINYLIKYKNILPKEILCISFTRASANSLKNKILKEFSVDMPVYTFHKLSLEILKEGNTKYEITDNDTLEDIIHKFFYIDILNSYIYMKKILKYFKAKIGKDMKKSYVKFIYSNNQLPLLEKLLSTFIKLFKCNNHTLEDFNDFLKKAKKTIFYNKYKREKLFLTFALNIYLTYQEYLKENNEIDFDDMIINATKYITVSGIKNKYKYIIIDEHQDTSYIRFLLVKSILDKTNAKLMVVGDDFQSIYRFTGCDLSLFLNFNNYFSDSKIKKIENTYRNSIELITVAGNFVMKNKSQIKKNLKSNKSIDRPIEIIFYKDINKSFLYLINNIYEKTHKPIMILGRNNNDINLALDKNFKLENDGKIIYLKNKEIDIYYLTAHKSKGLEEENVIIINLENKLLGFPNKIQDDKILRFVSRNYEKYPYSEERRLFYVALTRTKNKTYLLVPKNNPSIFVKELLLCYSSKIKVLKSL